MKLLVMVLTIMLSIPPYLGAQTSSNYSHGIQEWDSLRVIDLKSGNGWLNLVGLYWLKEGKQTFGSGNTADMKFPVGSIAPLAGSVTLKGKTVTMQVAKDVAIKVNDKPVQSAIIFHEDSASNPVVSFGSLRGTVIKRGDKIGLRVRDLNSAAVNNFKGIERFVLDSNWRVEGTIIKGEQSQVFITNVIGQTTGQPSPGKVQFMLHGKTYSLDAIEDGNELLIVFGDATSGTETYGAGRFLSVEKPKSGNRVILDFNKAYNPPCAFTPFATCPLPPPQNILPIKILAGEKDYHH